MARSTPAQNDRGPASRIRLGPAAAAQASRIGAAWRSARQALSPSRRIAGETGPQLPVSETARTTATGAFQTAAVRAADSMSTAIAPVAARAARSEPRTTWSVDTTGPTRTDRPARRRAAATSAAEGRVTVVPGPRSEEHTSELQS